MQIVDDKEVNYTMHHSAQGLTCNTCVYYGLEVELKEDTQDPRTLIKRTMDPDDLALFIKLNINTLGYCTTLKGILLVNVPSNHSCPRYTKNTNIEYDDDRIG